MAIRTEERAFEGKNLAYLVYKIAFVILNCLKFHSFYHHHDYFLLGRQIKQEEKHGIIP